MKATIQEYKNNVAKLYIEAESTDSVVVPVDRKTVKIYINSKTKEQFNDEIAEYLTAFKNGLITESKTLGEVKEADVVNSVIKEKIAIQEKIEAEVI